MNKEKTWDIEVYLISRGGRVPTLYNNQKGYKIAWAYRKRNYDWILKNEPTRKDIDDYKIEGFMANRTTPVHKIDQHPAVIT